MRLEEKDIKNIKRFKPLITENRGKTIYWFTEEATNRRKLKCYYDVVNSGKVGTFSERREAAKAYVLTEHELSRVFTNMHFYGYINGLYKDNTFKSEWASSNFYGYYWTGEEWKRMPGIYHVEEGKFVRNEKTDRNKTYKPHKVNTIKLLKAIIMYFNKVSTPDIYNATGVTPNMLFKALKRFAATGKVRNKQILSVKELPRYADIISSVRYQKDWEVKTNNNKKIVAKALLAHTYNMLLKALVGKPSAKTELNLKKTLVLQGTKK